MNARAASVRLLVLDADGVLTDGRIVYTSQGLETKAFHVRDGLGMKVWRELGFKLAICTGRGGEAVRRRAAELHADAFREAVGDKRQAILEIAAVQGVAPSEVAVMGDDWPDLPAFEVAGYAMAPGDAHPDVRTKAHFVTRALGGAGAVREAIEHLIDAKGLLAEARAGRGARP